MIRTRLATAVSVGLLVGAALHPAPASAAVRRVASTGDAIGFATAPDGTVYVIGQNGTLRPLVAKSLGSPLLDISDDVSDGNEQGLLGAVFSPDSMWLYTNHTDSDGDTQVTAWPIDAGTIDPTRKRVLLTVDQPYGNHNGGHLVLDRAGVLWIGLGDGGSAGDPENRAQDPKSLLGKMLRIVPTPRGQQPYGIPAGNLPASKGRPEIWAVGLRNPWRFAIDETRKQVWIADVGQNEWEEINVAPLDAVGANFGWPNSEGRHPYNKRAAIPGAIRPVYGYRHGSRGCSVTGGVVLSSGWYLFSDFCSGRVQTVSPIGRSSSYTKATVKNAAGFTVTPDGRLLAASRGEGVVEVTRERR